MKHSLKRFKPSFRASLTARAGFGMRPISSALSASLACLALSAAPAASQSLMGPGLPNLTYTNSELYRTLSTFHPVSSVNPSDGKGMNSVAMHKGYLFFIYGEDSGRPGGGISFYD